jgi:hypothetical protein
MSSQLSKAGQLFCGLIHTTVIFEVTVDASNSFYYTGLIIGAEVQFPSEAITLEIESISKHFESSKHDGRHNVYFNDVKHYLLFKDGNEVIVEKTVKINTFIGEGIGKTTVTIKRISDC